MLARRRVHDLASMQKSHATHAQTINSRSVQICPDIRSVTAVEQQPVTLTRFCIPLDAAGIHQNELRAGPWMRDILQGQYINASNHQNSKRCDVINPSLVPTCGLS